MHVVVFPIIKASSGSKRIGFGLSETILQYKTANSWAVCAPKIIVEPEIVLKGEGLENKGIVNAAVCNHYHYIFFLCSVCL